MRTILATAALALSVTVTACSASTSPAAKPSTVTVTAPAPAPSTVTETVTETETQTETAAASSLLTSQQFLNEIHHQMTMNGYIPDQTMVHLGKGVCAALGRGASLAEVEKPANQQLNISTKEVRDLMTLSIMAFCPDQSGKL